MPSSSMSAARLCAARDVPEGHARGFAAQRLFVLRHAGTLHAWRDVCPHDGCSPLPWRRDAYLNASGTHIVCAAHGAQFEPDSGLCTLGPCQGQSLTRVPLMVTAEGDLTVPACVDQETSL